MREKGLATMATDSASTKRGLSRRDVFVAGLVLPALGTGVGAASLLVPGPAKAATAGQCVVAVTQEAVNFNPLLYVNTGVETSVLDLVSILREISGAASFDPQFAPARLGELASLLPETRPMPAGWISFGSIKLVQTEAAGLIGLADHRRCATAAALSPS